MFLEWQRPKTRHPLHFIFLIYGKPGLESRPSQILSDTCSGFCPLSYNERLEHTLPIEMLFLLKEQQTFHIPRVPCNFQQTELQHLSHRRWVHNSRSCQPYISGLEAVQSVYFLSLCLLPHRRPTLPTSQRLRSQDRLHAQFADKASKATSCFQDMLKNRLPLLILGDFFFF